MGEAENIRKRGTLPGIVTIGYPTPGGPGEQTHHYLKNTEAAVRRGQSVAGWITLGSIFSAMCRTLLCVRCFASRPRTSI